MAGEGESYAPEAATLHADHRRTSQIREVGEMPSLDIQDVRGEKEKTPERAYIHRGKFMGHVCEVG